MLKTELKPEIFEDVVDSIMQTEEWLQIEMNDPRINEAENAVMALLDGIKEQIPDDTYNQLMDAIWGLAAATAETATLYGMSVANTLREVAANPILYSQHVVDRMAKRGNVA